MDFPNSHRHLLSFGVLAIAMTLIFASQAGAEDKGAGDSAERAPSESSIPLENRGPSNPDDHKFVDQRPMNDTMGRPDFGNPNMGPNNQPGDSGKMNDGFGRPMNDNFDNKNFGNDKFGHPMNNPQNNFGPNGPDRMMNPGQPDQNRYMENDRGQDQSEQFNKQMVQNAQQQVRGFEQQLKQFDKQVQALTKQNLPVPAEISGSLTKMRTIIAAVKNAKSVDDLEAAGWEDIRDEMNALYENQRLLQELAQWPKALKMIDKQITSMTRELKKYKSLSDKLQKNEVDVSSLYTELERAVLSLKMYRDEAAAKVAAGDVETAYEILEDKFFDAFEIIREKQQILKTMSNVGRFPSEFKKAQKQITRTISQLKKQKVSTVELEQLEITINQKGQAIQQLIKARPIDMDAIMDALEDLSDVRQDFMDEIQTLMGDSVDMPWEQGSGMNNSFPPVFNF